MSLAVSCTDIPDFDGGHIFDVDYAERSPAAAVFPAFEQSRRDLDWEILTGDQLHESSSDTRMNEVFLVQREDSIIKRGLRARGAILAFILSGTAESTGQLEPSQPLFASPTQSPDPRRCIPKGSAENHEHLSTAKVTAVNTAVFGSSVHKSTPVSKKGLPP